MQLCQWMDVAKEKETFKAKTEYRRNDPSGRPPSNEEDEP
jgi:hypothetical protein